MQVDHLTWEPAEEAHRQHAHPAREHDEVRLEPGDQIGESGVVLGALLARVQPDVHGGHAGGVGTLEREHVRTVGDHGHDVAGDAAVGARVEHRLQVGSVAGDHHDEPPAPHRSTTVTNMDRT